MSFRPQSPLPLLGHKGQLGNLLRGTVSSTTEKGFSATTPAHIGVSAALAAVGYYFAGPLAALSLVAVHQIGTGLAGHLGVGGFYDLHDPWNQGQYPVGPVSHNRDFFDLY